MDPPAELEARLEETLGTLVGLAADELEGWELSAVKDPKNWIRLARPAAAVVIGSGAAVGLVIVRTQRKRHGRRRDAANTVDLVGRTCATSRARPGASSTTSSDPAGATRRKDRTRHARPPLPRR